MNNSFLKKALSLTLSLALVITGISFSANKTKAATEDDCEYATVEDISVSSGENNLVFDDNEDGTYTVQWAGTSASDWMQIDLGEATEVDRIAGLHVSASNSLAYAGIKLQYSEDGENWTDLVSAKSGNELLSDEDITARYFKLVHTYGIPIWNIYGNDFRVVKKTEGKHDIVCSVSESEDNFGFNEKADGTYTCIWGAFESDDAGKTMTFDFGDVKTVEEFKNLSISKSQSLAYTKFDIETSEDGENWTKISEGRSITDARYTFNIPTPFTARYLRLKSIFGLPIFEVRTTNLKIKFEKEDETTEDEGLKLSVPCDTNVRPLPDDKYGYTSQLQSLYDYTDGEWGVGSDTVTNGDITVAFKENSEEFVVTADTEDAKPMTVVLAYNPLETNNTSSNLGERIREIPVAPTAAYEFKIEDGELISTPLPVPEVKNDNEEETTTGNVVETTTGNEEITTDNVESTTEEVTTENAGDIVTHEWEDNTTEVSTTEVTTNEEPTGDVETTTETPNVEPTKETGTEAPVVTSDDGKENPTVVYTNKATKKVKIKVKKSAKKLGKIKKYQFRLYKTKKNAKKNKKIIVKKTSKKRITWVKISDKKVKKFKLAKKKKLYFRYRVYRKGKWSKWFKPKKVKIKTIKKKTK